MDRISYVEEYLTNLHTDLQDPYGNESPLHEFVYHDAEGSVRVRCDDSQEEHL
jgi:hypothetical protein